MKVSPRLVIAGAVFFYACGKDSPTSPPPGLGTVGLDVVAGAGVTDSVGALQLQALVVELHDSKGTPAKRTVVRFTGLQGPSGPQMYVGTLGAPFPGPFAVDTTDDSGRAAVVVRMGFNAGLGRAEISVPLLGLADTVEYTILPGNANRVIITPTDTALSQDANYPLTFSVRDAYGNVRSDPITWSTSGGSGIAVSNTGVVSTPVAGRYSITGTAGAIATTVKVSVIPRLRLVANDGAKIMVMDLDGSNKKALTQFANGGIGSHPSWIPGTDLIAYSSLANETQLLYAVDQAGVSNLLIKSPLATMSHQAEPTPSADGNWLFFSAFDTRCGDDYCVFRSKPDGSAPELLQAGFPSRQPAPSPDGSKVAFVRDNFSSDIRVLDVASGVVSAWSVPGQHPRWSPDGSKIAFMLNGHVMLMSPDGTNLVQLSPFDRGYASHPISWSPDGKWVIAKADFFGLLELIDVASKATMPLPFSGNLNSPALK